MTRRVFEGLPGDLNHVGLSLHHKDRHTNLRAKSSQLVHGGRTIHIGGHKQRQLPLLQQHFGQLAGAGGLARAVETAHQNTGRVAGKVKPLVLRSQQSDQLIADDLDHLLAGVDRLDNLFAQGLSLD